MTNCLVPLVVLALAALSAGCNAADPGFSRVAPQLAATSDHRFLMRRAGSLVEVTRLSPEWRPRFADIARQAALAARTETGCAVAWARGDPAVLILGLACPGTPVPEKPRGATELLCQTQRAGPLSEQRALRCSVI